jgi:hypothetical protein
MPFRERIVLSVIALGMGLGRERDFITGNLNGHVCILYIYRSVIRVLLVRRTSEMSGFSESSERTIMAAAVDAETFCSEVVDAGFPTLKMIRLLLLRDVCNNG